MRMVMAVNDDGLNPEGVVQIFRGDTLIIAREMLGGVTFSDAVGRTVAVAMVAVAQVEDLYGATQLLGQIHEAVFTRKAALPTPLHDRLLDFLTKAGATP